MFKLCFNKNLGLFLRAIIFQINYHLKKIPEFKKNLIFITFQDNIDIYIMMNLLTH